MSTENSFDEICSPLERAHPPFFVQKQYVGDDLKGRSRVDVFRQICEGKRVLHVGCVDWPITDLQRSLHLQLDSCCTLDGFDIHPEAFEIMQPHVRGRLFSDWSQVQGPYDLVLVPEVLEHVPDVQGFLRQLDAVGASQYVITVPDAYSCFAGHFDYSKGVQTFVEVVHPDHNCWYTPYTLANVLRKYTPWSLQGMWFFNRISLLAVATRATSSA
ncbi:MAG: class I SAM-dependent methyltransferase [Roseateles asaccharophilus]|uniref:Methyltransferase family protein n=1 Tax=Roseateles asaccharophilus TaxID=582607 RepID=A0A4R6MT72_9BURK|nr:methyltransferase domain-containing protein [Roseateles asaccharophilus]MDN3546526.1 methyltransferase domain-containing protein [Roseateles asaccharophilus]TDP05566.1 methyltransferase family protein [Roseateles asaccharophilus]